MFWPVTRSDQAHWGKQGADHVVRYLGATEGELSGGRIVELYHQFAG